MVTYAARAGSEAMFNMVKSEMRAIMDEAIGKMSTTTPSTELCDVEDVQIKQVGGDPSPDKKKIRVEKAKGRNRNLLEGEESNRYHYLTSDYFIRHPFLRDLPLAQKTEKKTPTRTHVEYAESSAQ